MRSQFLYASMNFNTNRTMHPLRPLVSITLALATFSAAAQTLDLQASSEKEVARNEMVIRLFVERNGRAVDELNKLVTQEVAKAKRATPEGVQFANAGLSTLPVYDKNGKTEQWAVRATVEIRGADKKAVASVGTTLSQFMAFESIRFELGKAELEKTRNSLIQEVTNSFKERARIATESLGFSRYEISEVYLDVASSDVPRAYPQMARTKTLAFETAQATVEGLSEGGVEKVTTTVRGRVALIK